MKQDWTLEVWVRDARYKGGQRLQGKYEYQNQDLKWMQEEVRDLQHKLYPQPKYRVEVHETWVTRRNAMTGVEFKERYDTPWFASPSSETYWSS